MMNERMSIFAFPEDEGERDLLKLRYYAGEGDARAQRELGILYLDGSGNSENLDEAIGWLRKAAEQGDVEAQYRLGKCYVEGSGVRRDSETAEKWFGLAAKQGHSEAARAVKAPYYAIANWFCLLAALLGGIVGSLFFNSPMGLVLGLIVGGCIVYMMLNN